MELGWVRMERLILDNGKKAKDMEKESKFGIMEKKNILDLGNIINVLEV